ncbi:MAG: ribosome maturation factor RimM, partial [Actinomycetota bacterium]|nr:ribosome maturation factor RimM [Actinomycetota bacterium]
PELRFAAGTVIATEPAASGPQTITGFRWHSGRLLLHFAGFDDRDHADDLRGITLVVESDDLEDTGDPEEFRDHQLIGLTVLTAAGEQVGRVTDVLHYGQDLLVISGDGPRQGAEILVPFVAALVPEVDVSAGRLVIDPPPGLLDPDFAS